MGKFSAEEIRLRGILLAKDKDLLKLHHDLVISGMVTEDEFWEARKSLLASQMVLMQQKKAPSTASVMGVEIKPHTDIQGDLKFVLTPALIQSVFEQNPIVKRAYNEKVPGFVDEKGFWMQYFTSKFFQDGLSAPQIQDQKLKSPNANLFDEYYLESQQEKADDLAIRTIEDLPISIDILATAEDHFQAADEPIVETSKEEREKSKTIRKLNRISAGIVEASHAQRIGPDPVEVIRAATSEDYIPLDLKQASFETKDRPELDTARLKQMADQILPISHANINLIDYTRYSSIMQNHRPVEHTVMPSATQLQSISPETFQTFLSNTIELLRQFWSAYPPGNNAKLAEKAIRMGSILEQMLQNLDSWLKKAVRDEERQYMKQTAGHLRLAAEVAIRHADALHSHPSSSTAVKRARVE